MTTALQWVGGIGTLAEMVGLVIAAWGLWHAWRNAGAGFSIWTGRRNEPQHLTASGGLNVRMHATGRFVTEGETPEAAIADIRSELDGVHLRLDRIADSVEDTEARMRHEVLAAEERGRETARAQTRADTRAAAAGLCLAALGLIAQTFSGWALG